MTEYIELSSFPVDPPERPERRPLSLTNSQLQFICLRLGIISDEEYSQSKSEIEDEDLITIAPSAEFMVERVDEMSESDALQILRDALAEHNGDVNFMKEDYELISRLVNKTHLDVTSKSFPKNRTYLVVHDWNLQVRLEACLIHFHSPYPEIRSITDPFDDPLVPVETLRVYVIGLFWTIVGSIVNNFFVHRMPSIRLSSHTIQILLLPCGKLWERYVPKRIIHVWGRAIDLNPGPWTYKEMMLATIIYSCSSGTPYSVYNIFVMKLDRFYGLKWVTLTYQFFLAISTQFLGFGFALIMKKVCVYPAKAIWPTILPIIVLNRALLKEGDNEVPGHSIHGWTISRYSFFYVVFFASFIYNWIPSYLFTALSTFNWPTWLSPSSIHLVNVTGSNAGLGLNPLPSFDWNIINAGECLTFPFYTYVNQYLGTVLALVTILIVYYTNNKWTGYFPINSNKLFNNKAEVYKVHDILNEKSQFDVGKYEQVGPPYFSAANLVLYGAYFTLYPFAILYNFAVEWSSMRASFANVYYTIADAFKSNSSEKQSQFGKYSDDPHCKMMSKYDDVPDWWFLLILAISTCFALAAVTLYPSETPIWGIFFTIVINFIFLIPLTSIASVTGFSFGLNVLVELIVGYAIPNSGIALITLKSYGYNIDSQASNYITDQKLAHYAKVPPRAIFRGQLISTLISVCIALAIANWQIDNIEDICSQHQKDKFSCPGANTFFYSSIQYGEIGPAKVFSGMYPVLKWCFLLGVVLVIPCVWFKQKGPDKLARYFQPTIIIGGFLNYAPYNLSYYTMGLYISFASMYYAKKNYLLWWEKYNYILTSALSAGVAISALLMFFTVQYNPHTISWWGNEISHQGIEGGIVPDTWLKVENAPEGYVGLRKGHFP